MPVRPLVQHLLNGSFTFLKSLVSPGNTAFLCFARQTCGPSLNALKWSIFTVLPSPTSRSDFGPKTQRKVCNPVFMELQTFPRFCTGIPLVSGVFRPFSAFLRVISWINPDRSIFLCLSENSQQPFCEKQTAPHNCYNGCIFGGKVHLRGQKLSQLHMSQR